MFYEDNLLYWQNVKYMLFTIKAHKGISQCTWHIIPTRWIHQTTRFYSSIVVGLWWRPQSHTSQCLISHGPAPAIDGIVQSNPSTRTEMLSLCFILKLDHVIITFYDSQVIVCGSAVSLSLTPCFLLLDQIVLTRNRKDERGESCGGFVQG